MNLPDEGDVRVNFDDSIITDTAAEKQQDMAEVAAGLMLPNEYRAKWYGESVIRKWRMPSEERDSLAKRTASTNPRDC